MFSWVGPCSGQAVWPGMCFQRLVKKPGMLPYWESTVGEKRLEAVLGRAGCLLSAMCSEVRCGGSQHPSCWTNCSGEELFLRVSVTLSLPLLPEFSPFAQSCQP